MLNNEGDQMKKRYLVIAYDDDQQQTFYDTVYTSSEEEAKGLVERHRDYAVAVSAISPEELRTIADNVLSCPSNEVWS